MASCSNSESCSLLDMTLSVDGWIVRGSSPPLCAYGPLIARLVTRSKTERGAKRTQGLRFHDLGVVAFLGPFAGAQRDCQQTGLDLKTGPMMDLRAQAAIMEHAPWKPLGVRDRSRQCTRFCAVGEAATAKHTGPDLKTRPRAANSD
jgi:hypothetical protein